MRQTRPQRLRPGDTIGIVSPSLPAAAKYPIRFKRGIRNLERMGYNIKIGKNAKRAYGHKAGAPAARVEDLHQMFEDESVVAIVTSVGGYNSNELLDLLDFALIRRNPKIFCGYSDITALHCGIYSRTGLVTFYGPQLMPQFAEFGGLMRYTRKWFEKLLSNAKPAGRITPSTTYTYERLEWEQDDSRPRKTIPSPGWNVLREGTGKGKLVGGHLGTMLRLAGSKFFPNFDGAILFWEDTESSTALTDSMLRQLKMLGVFDKISGMLVGRVNPREYTVTNEQMGLHQVILDAVRDTDFPIMAEMDFGHTDPMITMPYGIEAGVDTRNGSKEFSILAPAVK